LPRNEIFSEFAAQRTYFFNFLNAVLPYHLHSKQLGTIIRFPSVFAKRNKYKTRFWSIMETGYCMAANERN